MPTPEDVLGFRLGSREATNREIGRYWRAADQASDRVVTGVYARSWQGRPLRYALVSNASTLDALPTIRQDLDRLRDPSTPEEEAGEIIARTPTILWIAANVHGNEPSGADAVVRLLHQLADRSDCVASEILDNAIVGLIPVQNPDGRAHDTRYNSYAFDMNRDGLVGTQPEVAGRLRLLWDYPPQLFVDEHENSGRNYFFPPIADPIYHETPNGLYREVQQMYGPANAKTFRSRGWRYETWKSGYDFFAQVYGDTVPTTQMGAVGMTFEQGRRLAVPAARAPPVPVGAHHALHGRDPPGQRAAYVAQHLRPGTGTRARAAAWSRTASSTRAITCSDVSRTVRSAATSCSGTRERPGAW